MTNEQINQQKKRIGQILSKIRKEKGITYYQCKKQGLQDQLAKAIDDGRGYSINSLLKYQHILGVNIINLD